ncbi:MAG TPA: 2-oxo acid dehydrogenase subunit E2 [Ktedonobacterales bacterium]|nr:2-oxo acid dehydrogenase subunit E2 [Ktedonobacterales bacterium]
MTRRTTRYQMVPYSKMRRAATANLRSFQRKPMVHGLIEVDVTKARAFIQEHKTRTGEALSFTAFIIACMAKAIDEHKSVQAYRWGWKRLVVFDDVDVAVVIERDVAGQKVPLLYVIRAANRKTFQQIHREIRAIQARDPAKSVLGFSALPLVPPALFPRILYRTLRTFPWLHKRVVGTVGITAIGMFGTGSGWGIPTAASTLALTLGGMAPKPAVVDGRIAIRDILCITVSFDHRITDGGPAARFTDRLRELIESGYGLPNLAEAQAQATSQETAPALA